MVIALGLEYDGSGFSGWQSQPGVSTVQDSLETALSSVADHPIKVICAGRTDTGVHATGQVVHFESAAARSPRSWVLGANSSLPPGITVLWAQAVTDDFHARFRARSRRYRYVILNRWTRPAILRARVTWQRKPLDVTLMQAASTYLLGEHDFSSFRALACQAKSPVRHVYELNVSGAGDYVYIDVHANGFLYHMVRNIAGVLMSVGAGEQRPAWVQELLAVKNRARGGVTAPPDGLYLVHVAYDPRFGLPAGFAPPRYG